MEKKINILTLLITLCLTTSVFSQEETTNPNPSISEQFDIAYDKANNYQDYKVIKKSVFLSLKKNTQDSLTTLKRTLKEKLAILDKNDEETNLLKNEITTLKSELEIVNNEKKSVSFFGTLISKTTYAFIMWGIVIVLALLLGVFIYKFRNSNSITSESRKALEILEAEYEEHRRNSIEREQKVRRQLQDEINKNRESKK